MMTGIIEHQKAHTIVAHVTQVRTDVQEAFRLLQSAKARLAATLGDGLHTPYGHLWDREISDYNPSAPPKRSILTWNAMPGSTCWPRPG